MDLALGHFEVVGRVDLDAFEFVGLSGRHLDRSSNTNCELRSM